MLEEKRFPSVDSRLFSVCEVGPVWTHTLKMQGMRAGGQQMGEGSREGQCQGAIHMHLCWVFHTGNCSLEAVSYRLYHIA